VITESCDSEQNQQNVEPVTPSACQATDQNSVQCGSPLLSSDLHQRKQQLRFVDVVTSAK